MFEQTSGFDSKSKSRHNFSFKSIISMSLHLCLNNKYEMYYIKNFKKDFELTFLLCCLFT